MTRTWQQNSELINGLWPQCQWTDDEIDLWRSDLSVLDQEVLFEAIREVKRSRDSLYPQLAWVLASYRTIVHAKREAEKANAVREPAFAGDRLEIDPAESRRLSAEIGAEIESAGPEDVDAILEKINSNIDRLDAIVAVRLSWRAGARRVADKTLAKDRNSVFICGSEQDFEKMRAHALAALRPPT